MNPFKLTTPPPPELIPPTNQTPYPNPNPRNPRQKKDVFELRTTKNQATEP